MNQRNDFSWLQQTFERSKCKPLVLKKIKLLNKDGIQLFSFPSYCILILSIIISMLNMTLILFEIAFSQFQKINKNHNKF